MYNRNEAYDFKTLREKETKKGKVFRLPGNKARRKERIKAQKMLLVSTFSIFLVTAMCISGFVLGQARLTEFTDKAFKASRELEEYQSINTQLSMKLEAAKSSDDNRGLKNKNDCTVELVRIPKGDAAKIS